MKLLHEEFPKVRSHADLRALVEDFGLGFTGSTPDEGEYPQLDQYVRADGGETARLRHYWHGAKSIEPRRNGNKVTLEIRRDGAANASHLDSLIFREQ